MGHKAPFLIILTIWLAGLFSANYISLPAWVLSLPFILAALLCFTSHLLWIKDTILLLSILSFSFAFNQTLPPLEQNRSYIIDGKCEEELPFQNYIVSTGKRRLILQSDSSQRIIPGDSLHLIGKIFLLNNRANAFASSYQSYLAQKGIFYRIIPEQSITVTGHTDNLYSLLQKLRVRLLAKTDLCIPDSLASSLLKAIGLGYKNDLQVETKQLFADSGSIHLLAVSGLHMSTIFYILSILLKKITSSENSRYKLTIIPFLWAYAAITGLSPSVVRAAQILTFIIIGDAFAKDYAPINTVAASALFTLLIDKYAIYSLSMQMSYAAYTGIVLIYPRLNYLIRKLPPFIDSVFSLMCISLSAQLLTIPLALYHFHYISITSFIINILVVPLTSYILYSYILFLILPVFIGNKIVFLICLSIQILLLLLKSFEPINIMLSNIYPTAIHIILIYIFFLSIFLFYTHKKSRFIYPLTACLIFIGYSHTFNICSKSRKEVIVFHLHKERCILLNYHGHYTLLSGKIDSKHQVQPYINRYGLIPIQHYPIEFTGKEISFHNNLLSGKSSNIFIASPQYCNLPNRVDILIITENLSPQKLNISSSVSQIIIDNSNNYHCHLRWQHYCEENNITFNSTKEQGSIIIPIR